MADAKGALKQAYEDGYRDATVEFGPADAIAAGEPTAKAPFTYCEKCGNAAAVGLTCTCDVPKPTLDFVLDAVDEFEAMHSNACHDQATNSDHVACKTAKVRLQKTIIALHTYGASSAGTPHGAREPNPEQWMAEARGTLERLSAFLQAIGAPHAIDWRKWIDNAEKYVLALKAREPSEDAKEAARVPMTEAQIVKIYTAWDKKGGESFADLMRRVEAFHGIGQSAKEKQHGNR